MGEPRTVQGLKEGIFPTPENGSATLKIIMTLWWSFATIKKKIKFHEN